MSIKSAEKIDKMPHGESGWRSFAKSLSWRVVGSLDTFFLSYFLIKYLGPYVGIEESGSNLEIAQTASYIALFEIFTKIAIYTLHERMWNKVKWGIASRKGKRHETRHRSVCKMATWRILASLDTAIIAWFFTGNLATAMSIGSLEVITKLVLYYFHERAWVKIPFGLR